MLTEHYLSLFVSGCNFQIVCHDSGLLVKWIGADQKSRNYLETSLFRLNNAGTVYYFPLCASKGQFKNTGHSCLSFCMSRVNLKGFFSPNTPVNNSPAYFLVFVFTNGLIILLDRGVNLEFRNLL